MLGIGRWITQTLKRWFSSFLQTYHWLLAHDIGWAGQGLEAGMPGYWSVSMQNLVYCCGLFEECYRHGFEDDIREFGAGHLLPDHARIHCYPHGMFQKPISKAYQGISGVISGKPIELPGSASGSPPIVRLRLSQSKVGRILFYQSVDGQVE